MLVPTTEKSTEPPKPYKLEISAGAELVLY